MAKGIRHDEEFKKTIVQLVESGKPVSTVASEYGLDRRIIYTWKRLYGTLISKDGAVTTNKEINDLVKKNKQLQDEVDILKKAMVIFTKK